MKLTIIGGGSFFTPLLLKGLENFQDDFQVQEVALLDINSAAVEQVGDYSQKILNDRLDYPVKILPTTDYEEALSDSNYIIFTVRIGGLESRVKDEKIPLKYGVFGDETTGPGGFSNSLRTIPVFMDYARKIERLAPDAWVIPFTNPEGILTEALSDYSNVNVIGICTAPFALWDGLAKHIGVERSRVSLDLFGLTHTGWVRGIFLDGVDILPNFIHERKKSNRDNALYPIEVIEKLDCIPAHWFYSLAGRSLPHWYYHRELLFDQQIEAGKTRGEELMEIMSEIPKDDLLALDIDELEKKRGHQVIDEPILALINALENDKNECHIVDVPNNGCVEGFKENMVIEMPARINSSGATPMPIKKISPEARGLMQSIKAYEELTIDAAIHGSYEKALRALLAHPLTMSFEIVKPMLDDILFANKEFLPDYWDLDSLI